MHDEGHVNARTLTDVWYIKLDNSDVFTNSSLNEQTTTTTIKQDIRTTRIKATNQLKQNTTTT